jgi:hypothetical protein
MWLVIDYIYIHWSFSLVRIHGIEINEWNKNERGRCHRHMRWFGNFWTFWNRVLNTYRFYGVLLIVGRRGVRRWCCTLLTSVTYDVNQGYPSYCAILCEYVVVDKVVEYIGVGDFGKYEFCKGNVSGRRSNTNFYSLIYLQKMF